jgi:thioredoxin 1
VASQASGSRHTGWRDWSGTGCRETQACPQSGVPSAALARKRLESGLSHRHLGVTSGTARFDIATGGGAASSLESIMATHKVTTSSFKADVLDSDKPVVVDFWAEWCGPCRMIAPALEELAAEMPGVKIAKVNIDENPELAAQFGVRSIPTLLMFKGGQVASNMVGAAPKSRLSSWIASAA